jgi:hypothetical protein
MFESVECLALSVLVVLVIVLFVAHKLEQGRIKTNALMWNIKFGKWQ